MVARRVTLSTSPSDSRGSSGVAEVGQGLRETVAGLPPPTPGAAGCGAQNSYFVTNDRNSDFEVFDKAC